MEATFDAELEKNPDATVIDVSAGGQLSSKRVYFLPWEIDSDDSVLRKSIKTFVRNAIRRVVLKGYHTIAFPAIGCGQLGCPINVVAEVMVQEAHYLSQTHGISVVFVIQPNKNDVYNEFQKQINQPHDLTLIPPSVKTISVPVHKGMIEVQKGDITKQKVSI